MQEKIREVKELLYKALTQETNDNKDVILTQTMEVKVPTISKKKIQNTQIQNVVTHITVMNIIAAQRILDDLLNPEIQEAIVVNDPTKIDLAEELRLETPIVDLLKRIEMQYLSMAFKRGKTKSAVSEIISLPVGTIYDKIKKLGMDL